jgi:drug/metabolite transporter (DMT)-like permease
VIAGTLPAVAALVAVILLRERPGAMTVIAIGLATAGVLVCSAGSAGTASLAEHGNAPSKWLGNACVLGAVVCEAVFILLNKRLVTPVSPLQMSTLMTGIGLAVSVAPALLFERPWASGLDRAAMAGVLYYALVPTVVGFFLWFAGASRIAGAQAGALTAFVPISAAAFAALVLHESIRPAHGWAMGCVLAAVLLIAFEGTHRKRDEADSNTRAGCGRNDPVIG